MWLDDKYMSYDEFEREYQWYLKTFLTSFSKSATL